MNDAQFQEDLQAYTQAHQDQILQDLKDIVAQPSVSSSGQGIEACCQMVKAKMEAIGLHVTQHDIKPYPALTGYYGSDPAKKTVLIYAHYDVQPVGKEELWRTPAFEPTVIDGVLYGRGTADNKGPLMAHLNAIEFHLKQYGQLPVNVKVIFEGCEESSSRGLPEFLAENKSLLQADMVYFSDGSMNHNNAPIIALGVKGMLYVELVLTTLKRDLHSQYATVLPSASWQMVELLGKLKKDGMVQIPGFYDDIIPPTEKEIEIYKTLPSVEESLKKNYGAYPVYPADKGYYLQLNGEPSFNLSGLVSGHIGDGSATILTSKATAKLDIRLVAAQSGTKILEQLKQYIKDLGYDNVEVKVHGITDPAKTSVETPYLVPVQKAVTTVFGDHMIYPNRPSTAPDYLWTNILGLPTIQVRWCDAVSDNHAPNEHLTLEYYYKGMMLTATALKDIGEM